jgi:4-amino-4-deoxy-L-arabinose transferase-like glycosyltransferase
LKQRQIPEENRQDGAVPGVFNGSQMTQALHYTTGNRVPDRRPILLAAVTLIVALTVMRGIYAGVFDLRTDEAYYWTWSKEGVLSFLDHPPMIAWFIRFGTAVFGDTNFGVRFAGLLAMAVTQLLLADIVRRVTHDLRAVIAVVLMPEAALYYGLLTAKVAPDVAMIPFAVAMLWSLVRLVESDDGRWWLAAGAFAGLALLSKLTVVMLVPGILAFMLVPGWRLRWLRSPYAWLAVLIAFVASSPVLIWNASHDWASFKFQFVRATTNNEVSLRTLGDFLGLQFGQVGLILFPVVLSAVVITAWRGYRRREPVAILLSTCVLVPFCYFVWKSLTLRIGDTWPMFIWPAGFAAAAINITLLSREGNWPRWMVRSAMPWAIAAIASGIALVVVIFLYCVAAPWNLVGKNDPIGGEAGYGPLAARALVEMDKVGATWIATSDYRTYAMLRWHLKDKVPVIQINERARFLGFRDPGFDRIKDHTGLYIAQTPDDHASLLASTSAVLERVAVVNTVWRGVAMKTYEMDKLTNWTPDLNPPPGTPFYKWPALAMDISPNYQIAALRLQQSESW